MEPYYYSRMNRTEQSAYHAMKTGLTALAPSFAVPRLENRELAAVAGWPALRALAGERLKGAAIWDPQVPATLNVATTFAGLEDAVVMSPECYERWGQDLPVMLDLRGKFASQITTSKHFYDVTAHRYVEENCFDLGMKVLRGLSADMEDLLSDQGQKEARMFFDQLIFSCEHGLPVTPPPKPPVEERPPYQSSLAPAAKRGGKDVVIVTNCAPEDTGLANMIADFRAALPYESRVVNLREFPFAGGCLGCFGCAITGKCVYKDGFDEFLRNTIQTADGFVYAFAISDHYTHSSFKCFDDRQFCNGHRTVTHGTPIAYLISGDYQYESNLRMIVEGRSEVGGNYLCGVATDEGNTAADIQTLADSLVFAMEKKLSRPANFYGVGGMKIFRDLIYVMQCLMKADHKFYKSHGIYDFPQKEKKRILQMKLVGAMLAVPSVQKKMKGQMNQYIIGPYQNVVEQTKGTRQ